VNRVLAVDKWLRKGFRILVTEPVMRRSVGAGKSHGKLGFVALNYPPQRWYYLLRNEVSLVREYLLPEPHWAVVTVISRIQKTIAMVLFEDRRLAKPRYAATGFTDGVLGRFTQPSCLSTRQATSEEQPPQPGGLPALTTPSHSGTELQVSVTVDSKSRRGNGGQRRSCASAWLW
jgi:hypothetical protein